MICRSLINLNNSSSSHISSVRSKTLSTQIFFINKSRTQDLFYRGLYLKETDSKLSQPTHINIQIISTNSY